MSDRVKRWFDGHLDLAMMAQLGREMRAEVETCGGEQLPASVTLPSLRAGGVRAALATVFIQRRVHPQNATADRKAVDGAWTYDDRAEAHEAALRQVRLYQQWHEEGLIRIATWPANGAALTVVILLEGCEGLRTPADLQMFYDAGARVVGLTWAEGTAYSGGDQTWTDVTPMGRELIREIDRLGMVHDLSHLSEKAFWTVMGEAQGRKIASHSNCRALLPGKIHYERHLSDEQIRAIVAAGGLIGINLFSRFLVSGPEAPERATIADVLRHMGRMEDLTGRRDFLALGSDMDGGFSADLLPADLTLPAHLSRLAEALSQSGWSDSEIERFAWGNWASLMSDMGIHMERV